MSFAAYRLNKNEFMSKHENAKKIKCEYATENLMPLTYDFMGP